MNIAETTPPPAGHNAPPVDLTHELENIAATLKAKHAAAFKRFETLEKSADDIPAKIKTDEISGQVGDLLILIRAAIVDAEDRRKKEKKPVLAAGKAIDALFNIPIEKAEKQFAEIKDRNTIYLEAKAAAAVLREQERARLAREKADQDAELARQAETRRLAAEEEERQAKAREEEARQAEQRAMQDARDAQDRAATAREAEEKALRDRQNREDAERKINATNLDTLHKLMDAAEALNVDATLGGDSATERDAELAEAIRPGSPLSIVGAALAASNLLDDDQLAAIEAVRVRLRVIRGDMNERAFAADAAERQRLHDEEETRLNAEAATQAAERERLRLADEERARVARETAEAAEAEAATKRAEAKDAKKDVREAVADAKEAKSDAREAGRDERQSMGAALRSEGVAERHDRKADAPIADQSRTRGELGSVASLTNIWVYRIDSWPTVKAIPVGTLFSDDEIEGAVSRAMHKGVREIAGVSIYRERDSRVG